MSDAVTDRIAAIVAEHQFRVDINGDPDQVFYCECQHMRAGDDARMLQMAATEHPAHVAEVIVEQLGLAESRTLLLYWANWSAEDKQKCHDHNCGHMRGDHSIFNAQCLRRLCLCDAFLAEPDA